MLELWEVVYCCSLGQDDHELFLVGFCNDDVVGGGEDEREGGWGEGGGKVGGRWGEVGRGCRTSWGMDA